MCVCAYVRMGIPDPVSCAYPILATRGMCVCVRMCVWESVTLCLVLIRYLRLKGCVCVRVCVRVRVYVCAYGNP